MTSQAQIEANRQNAQRSTGPRTPEGKQRSSQNATTHGVFSRTGLAIASGVFAEDPAEIQTFLDGIIEGLDPRDPVETAQAGVVAKAYLNDRRLGDFAAAALGAAGTDSADKRRQRIVAIQRELDIAASQEELRLALSGELDDPDCRRIFKLIERNHAQASAAIHRLWQGELPETPEDWAQAFEVLLDELFGPGHQAALQWITDQQAHTIHTIAVLEGGALADAAEHSLRTLDRVTVYGTRISLVLERALREYRLLRARPLPSPEPQTPPRPTKRILTAAEVSARETNPVLGPSIG